MDTIKRMVSKGLVVVVLAIAITVMGWGLLGTICALAVGETAVAAACLVAFAGGLVVGIACWDEIRDRKEVA